MERYQVELEGFPGNQSAFVKALRTIGKVSLSDANKTYVHASNFKRTVLVTGIEKGVAEHVAATFAEARVDVVVKESSVSTPMICRPQANSIYRWSDQRALVDA